ncbi:MAG: helix-turn-helix domain-containing protein [Planctomycetota bacterium]
MPYPHSFIKLTPDERKKIKKKLQKLAQGGQWKKRPPLQALLLSDDGRTFEQIYKWVGVHYRTVQKWFFKYRQKGLNAFLQD